MNPPRWHPGSLLELSGFYWRTCVLHAAVKLDIFTLIGQNLTTSEQIAKKLNADNQAVERLLNALVAMALLRKKDATFQNTREPMKG